MFSIRVVSLPEIEEMLATPIATVSVNCSTEEKAEHLLNGLAAKGYRWGNGDSLTDNTLWGFIEEDTCYTITRELGQRGEDIKTVYWGSATHEEIVYPNTTYDYIIYATDEEPGLAKENRELWEILWQLEENNRALKAELEELRPEFDLECGYWTSKDGTTHDFQDMSDSHLLNTINMLKKHYNKTYLLETLTFQGLMYEYIFRDI